MQRTEQNCVDLAAQLLPDAEKELTAFARSVRAQFGVEEAQHAMEDWIEELELMNWPKGGTLPDWRLLTVSAAARLSNRVDVEDLRTLPTLIQQRTQVFSFGNEIANH